MQSLTLYELNNLVRQTLEMTMYDEYWLRAEIAELRVSYHCYLEFVQKDSRGNGLVAKARATVWAGTWSYLRSHFERTTGQSISAGMEVLVKVKVSFHELYGYSLNVVDIDPTYTLGDIARKRLEIINTLKAEGVDQMNKELPLPRLLQRIAIISSPTAAGYGDFCNQLQNNKYHLAFITELFPAVMQGAGTEQSIISALNSIAERMDEWDVVVIIRGGGATSDLSGFDTLNLAENVAQFPLPIITGIGHERDDTVLDMVSHTRVKTPTAAAEFLIHHQESELAQVEDFADRLSYSVSNILSEQEQRIKILTSKLPALYSSFKAREESRLDRALMNIQNGIIRQTNRETTRIEMMEQRLVSDVTSFINKSQHDIEKISIRIEGADPQRILNLGFSITRVDGKAVNDASLLSKGQTIETTFAKGTIKSTIQ